MLYETLRNYFSVNTAGEMSFLYLFCISYLMVLQQPFYDYDTYRTKEALIASCKWQIGQLTNVLNHLYDPIQYRIYITQSDISYLSDPIFQYPPIHFDGVFDDPPIAEEREFNDRISVSTVTINIPAGLNESDLIATVEQIRMQGIPYQINVI